MPNLLNIPDDYDPTDASYGARYELPRFNPPGTYSGALPTPPSNAYQEGFELTPDYSWAQNVMGSDNAQLNALLKLLNMRRKNRT